MKKQLTIQQPLKSSDRTHIETIFRVYQDFDKTNLLSIVIKDNDILSFVLDNFNKEDVYYVTYEYVFDTGDTSEELGPIIIKYDTEERFNITTIPFTPKPYLDTRASNFNQEKFIVKINDPKFYFGHTELKYTSWEILNNIGVVLDKEEFKQDDPLSYVIPTDISKHNDFVLVKTKCYFEDNTVSYTGRLHVTLRKNEKIFNVDNLDIDYSTLNFIRPVNVRYLVKSVTYNLESNIDIEEMKRDDLKPFILNGPKYSEATFIYLKITLELFTGENIEETIKIR